VSAAGCVGEPISWLRLERHRLAELSAEESRAVETHLAVCAACAACAAETERPIALSPLPSPAARARPAARTGNLLRRLFGARPSAARPRLAFAGMGLGAIVVAMVAMAIVVGSRVGPAPGPGQEPGPIAVVEQESVPGSKGGDVAIDLVRERLGVIEHDAARFAPGDKWKVLVTCPGERVFYWDLMVVDAGRASFPLSPSAPIACGNHVVLPGAFRIEASTSVEVCLLLADHPLDRGRRLEGGLGRRVCARLSPTGSPRP
jgi:hypothetical protein